MKYDMVYMGYYILYNHAHPLMKHDSLKKIRCPSYYLDKFAMLTRDHIQYQLKL